jgi:hypothetical protein
VWQAVSGKEILTIGGQEWPRPVCLSHNGQSVLAINRQGVARLWPVDAFELAVKRKPRNLTQEERSQYGIDDPAESTTDQ